MSSNTTANGTVAIGLEAFEDMNGASESVVIGNKAGGKCTGGSGDNDDGEQEDLTWLIK